MADLLVSTRKGLFHVTSNEQDWSAKPPFFVGDNVSLALADGETWYAALNLGHFGVKMKSSTDRGATWKELAVPAYPEGAVIATADGKPPTPATLKQIWALDSHRGRLWCGTAPGGLFHSDDAGQTWILNEPLWNAPERMHWFGGGTDQPALHSICFHERNMLIAVSCGGVWRSPDLGETWANVGEGLFADFMPPELKFQKSIQDAHMMVQCAAQPEYVWVQHHNGVFASTNAAETFTHVANAPSNGFGFAVAVHPHDGKTAWFVPAVKDECRVPRDGRFAVTRTRDGGATFETITNGLPFGPAYDIVFRHALAVDSAGKVLAMGSTTGGLWISENGGMDWKEVEVRLPPVHAVRWV